MKQVINSLFRSLMKFGEDTYIDIDTGEVLFGFPEDGVLTTKEWKAL